MAEFFTDQQRQLVAKYRKILPPPTYIVSGGEEEFKWVESSAPAILALVNEDDEFTYGSFYSILKALTGQNDASARITDGIFQSVFEKNPKTLTGRVIFTRIHTIHEKYPYLLLEPWPFHAPEGERSGRDIPNEVIHGFVRPKIRYLFQYHEPDPLLQTKPSHQSTDREVEQALQKAAADLARHKGKPSRLGLKPLSESASSKQRASKEYKEGRRQQLQGWSTTESLLDAGQLIPGESLEEAARRSANEQIKLRSDTQEVLQSGKWKSASAIIEKFREIIRAESDESLEFCFAASKANSTDDGSEVGGPAIREPLPVESIDLDRLGRLEPQTLTRAVRETLQGTGQYSVEGNNEIPPELQPYLNRASQFDIPDRDKAIEYSIFRSNKDIPSDPDTEFNIIQQCEDLALDLEGRLEDHRTLTERAPNPARFQSVIDHYAQRTHGSTFSSFGEAHTRRFPEVEVRCLGLAVRDILYPDDSIEDLYEMGGAKPPPLLNAAGGSFYRSYDGSRPTSKGFTIEKSKEADLTKTGNQFYYHAIHARFLPSRDTERARLPPKHAQLEDADVYDLMRLVHVEGRYPISWLKANWDGVFNSSGFPLLHRRQMGRPAIERDEERGEYFYVCIKECYTLCGGGHLATFPTLNMDITDRPAGRTDWPWQRPLTQIVPSYKSQKDQTVFGFDHDMPVDWHAIQWPSFLDIDRSSNAFLTHLSNMQLQNRLPPSVAEAEEARSTTQYVPPDWTHDDWNFRKTSGSSKPNREDNESDYGDDDAPLARPMRSYMIPQEFLAAPEIPDTLSKAPQRPTALSSATPLGVASAPTTSATNLSTFVTKPPSTSIEPKGIGSATANPKDFDLDEDMYSAWETKEKPPEEHEPSADVQQPDPENYIDIASFTAQVTSTNAQFLPSTQLAHFNAEENSYTAFCKARGFERDIERTQQQLQSVQELERSLQQNLQNLQAQRDFELRTSVNQFNAGQGAQFFGVTIANATEAAVLRGMPVPSQNPPLLNADQLAVMTGMRRSDRDPAIVAEWQRYVGDNRMRQGDIHATLPADYTRNGLQGVADEGSKNAAVDVKNYLKNNVYFPGEVEFAASERGNFLHNRIQPITPVPAARAHSSMGPPPSSIRRTSVGVQVPRSDSPRALRSNQQATQSPTPSNTSISQAAAQAAAQQGQPNTPARSGTPQSHQSDTQAAQSPASPSSNASKRKRKSGDISSGIF